MPSPPKTIPVDCGKAVCIPVLANHKFGNVPVRCNHSNHSHMWQPQGLHILQPWQKRFVAVFRRSLAYSNLVIAQQHIQAPRLVHLPTKSPYS